MDIQLVGHQAKKERKISAAIYSIYLIVLIIQYHLKIRSER
jgi:hypothetical protein